MRSSLLFDTYHSIKTNMPGYVLACVKRLIPLGFFLIVLDIVGLFMLYPIVKLLLNPGFVFENTLLKGMYESFGFTSEAQFVLGIVVVTLLYFLIKSWIYYVVVRKQSDLAYAMVSRLIIDQYQRYIHAPLTFRSAGNTGDLLRSIIEIPYNFISGVLMSYVIFVNELALSILISLAVFIYNPILCITLGVTIIPTFYLYTRIQRKRLAKVSREREERHTEMFRQGKMGLEGFIEILVSGSDQFFVGEFRKSVKTFSSAMSRLYLYNAFSPRVMEVLLVASIFIVLLGATVLDYDLSMVATFLATFALAAYRLIPSVNKIILAYNNIKSAEFVYDHFSPQTYSGDVGFRPIETIERIDLNEVGFTYPGGKDVLGGINISIKKGDFVGLRGESGSGKTTLLRLLLRLIQPTTGEIQVNGEPLKDGKLEDWYAQVNYVPQQVTIFPGTITENIALGVEASRVDADRLRRAVQMSMLSSFVENLPMGLDTKMADQALNISGGQRQRIGIARALYQSGTVLILDEITSSLDEATERSITDCIENLVKENYTILMVSHNREALRYCHKIYALEQGLLSKPLTYEML